MGEPDVDADRPLGWAAALGWVALSVVLLGLVAGVAAGAVGAGAESDLWMMGASEAVAFLLVTLGILVVHRPGRGLREALALRPTHPGLLLLGAGLGMALQAPAQTLRALAEARSPTPDEELLALARLLAADTPWRLAGLVIVVPIAAPLVEELLFRGALFGGLSRTVGAASAVAATSTLFVVSHVAGLAGPGAALRAWLPLLPLAAVLGYLRASSGSLLPGLGLHVAFNAASIGALLSGSSALSREPDLPPAMVAAGWVVTAGLLGVVHLLSRTSDLAREARAEDLPP